VSVAQLARLPKPLFATYEGQRRAACAEGNPHMFFHPEGERGPAREQRERAAVALCAVCPVVEACRAHGLSAREPYGVWGGLTESDREAIYRRERRTNAKAAAG
jgi:WhiB family redox-sensing transcriptional regulator